MFLKKKSFLLLIAITIISFSSCTDGPSEVVPIETPSYENGVFIANQGIYGSGTGTISFYSRNTGLISNTIFQEANDGEELGNIVQSITVHNDLAYIVVNNAEKIVIANASDFKKVGEINGLKQPRYFLPVDDETAFVSQWGADGATGSIKVIDLKTNTISNTIDTRPGPEQMVKVDDAVYVANSGGFTTDSVISKIDIAAETISKTIEVGQGPISIVLDKNTEMWVLTRGHNDWNNPDNNRDGNLVKLNNDAIILSIVAKEGAGNLTINNSLDKLYFRMDNMVFEHPISENAISTTPFISRYFYGLGIDHKTDDLFALDPKSFDQDGSLIIYDSNASVLDSTKVGIAPGGLWFD